MAIISVDQAIDLLTDSGLVYAKLRQHLINSPAVPFHVRDRNKQGPQRVINIETGLAGYKLFTSSGIYMMAEHCDLSDTMGIVEEVKTVAAEVTYHVYVDNKLVHTFKAPAGQRREEVMKRVVVTS